MPAHDKYHSLLSGYGGRRISTQHLEETEDLTVHLLSEEEIKALLLNDEVKQSLMADRFGRILLYILIHSSITQIHFQGGFCPL